MNRLLNKLSENGITFSEQEPMSLHTSFKIGGAADLYVRPDSIAKLKLAVSIANEENVPVTVVGNGSNLLVSDKGIEGMVISLDKMCNITVSGEKIVAESGALLGRVATMAMENSLWGMEFAAGIPGSIGGAVYMNAGAYEGEMSQIVTGVTVLDGSEIKKLINEECCFGYRHSIFSEKNYIILSAEITLEKGDREKICERMKELSCRRREKQPLEYPSAGSTFKRPEGYFAGALIEKSGLKGYTVGGAQVSEKHAGFVINKGGATCADVLSVIKHIKEKVFSDSGVMLEEEVRVTGRAM